jgi:hypothetical protein
MSAKSSNFAPDFEKRKKYEKVFISDVRCLHIIINPYSLRVRLAGGAV